MATERWAVRETGPESDGWIYFGENEQGIPKRELDRVRVLDEGEVAVPVGVVREAAKLLALLPTPSKPYSADEWVKWGHGVSEREGMTAVGIRAEIAALVARHDAAKGEK